MGGKTMAEDTAAALAIINKAMNIEQTGSQFYLRAADTTLDKKGQETFRSLADDEQKHYDLLKRQQDSLHTLGKWTGAPEITPVAIDLNKPLFPKDIHEMEKRISAKSSESDALLFGLDIEVKSFDLYRKAAQETADPLGKQIFEFLASQEQGHFDVLMLRYDFLYGPVAWYP
jgi:rubrerythrin